MESLSGERWFEMLIKNVSDYAIYMLDTQGIVRSWNPGAERFKGYSATEIVGQHFSRFYTEQDRAAGIPARGLAIAAAEGKFETEGWRVRKDGTLFWASIVIDPIRDDQGRLVGFAKITRDITERKKAEEALEETRQALFQSQKMEAVGQLTGGVAHDFNNLLQAISGSIEMIERRLAAGRTDIEAFTAAARTSVDRAANLTQCLLAFSRRQPLTPKRTDLNQLVLGMRDLIEQSVGEAVRVETLLCPDLWPTWADANQVESSLLNLVINARDAMPEGGTLEIETRNINLDEKTRPPNISPEAAPGDYVMLAVRDNGTGIPPDILPRVFEPFFTTKPIGQGTGLGLSQLYGFARQSGGFIQLDSTVGVGTAVQIYLPRHQQAEETAEENAPASPETQPVGQGTVLVVEDEALVRLLLVEELKEHGYTVLEAEDGDKALAFLAKPEKIDLLATDVGLPGLNGRQLAEMARALRPDLKVLFLTGYAYNAAMEKEPLGPATQLLSKPIAISAFLAKVHEMMGK
ncbi:PAS domain-containing sensor histidine kinase [Telmatospirillum sp. J64-1]|uniref:PAS domain-containing sensor histidine kinase n=1 Tax=Telmatospirillum sp. J64-1 TaxID=2502183 RepID=UPI002102432E|nr:PAS domain-containing sensor histidine kinase [Telmatospirillum sp. J64-1]